MRVCVFARHLPLDAGAYRGEKTLSFKLYYSHDVFRGRNLNCISANSSCRIHYCPKSIMTCIPTSTRCTPHGAHNELMGAPTCQRQYCDGSAQDVSGFWQGGGGGRAVVALCQRGGVVDDGRYAMCSLRVIRGVVMASLGAWQGLYRSCGGGACSEMVVGVSGAPL